MVTKSDSLYDIWLELVQEEKEEEERLERERKEKEMGSTMSEANITSEVLQEGTVTPQPEPEPEPIPIMENVQKKRSIERKLRAHLNFMIDCGGVPSKLEQKVDPMIFEELWALQNDHQIKFGISTDYGHCSRIGKWVYLNEHFLFSEDGRQIHYGAFYR